MSTDQTSPVPERPFDAERDDLDFATGHGVDDLGLAVVSHHVEPERDPAEPGSERRVSDTEPAPHGDGGVQLVSDDRADDVDGVQVTAGQRDRVQSVERPTRRLMPVSADALNGPPIGQPTSTDGSPADEISANGAVVVGEPSRLNQRPWFAEEWFKLPSSGGARDIDAVHGLVGDVPVLGVSLRGTKNQYRGDVNQDAFFVTHDDNWIIVTVADGVSNATHSAYGARFAVEYLARRLAAERLSHDSAPSEIFGNLAQLLRYSSLGVGSWQEYCIGAPTVSRVDVDPADLPALLASTISVMLVSRHCDDGGRRRVEIACIGDSPVYCLRNGEWLLLTQPTKVGEIVSMATSSIPFPPSKTPEMETVSFITNPGDTLMVMSDGVSMSLGAGSSAVGAWLAQWFSTPTLLSDAVAALRFDRRGEDDDRTAVAVWNPPWPAVEK